MQEWDILNNRSVPTNVLLAHLTYEDLEGAAAWLAAHLGFREHFRYGEPLAGIQLHRGDAWIMLNLPAAPRAAPKTTGAITQYLTIVVEDVDAVYNTVTSAGADTVEELNETMYGERQFVVADPEGHRWLIAQHARDVAPEAWGATTAGKS
jgi:uncharacterized glyoxalase superfamily protein PhnB